MISPDVFSFIHNAVCTLTEAEEDEEEVGEVEGSERGSDLQINRAADGVDFTKFSPGLKIPRAPV